MLDNRLRRIDNVFYHNGFWLLAFLNLFGNFHHLFSKGFGLFFAVRVLFRVDNGGSFYRRFRLRLLFNGLLFFGFLLCFLLFFTEAQPGKEATFFLFCHLRLHSSRRYIHGS